MPNPACRSRAGEFLSRRRSFLVGALLFLVGLLFTIPFGLLMLAVAYDQMTHSDAI